MNIPSPTDVFAAFFATAHEPPPDLVVFGPCDRVIDLDPDQPVPFALTAGAEVELDAAEPDPEPEADPEAEAEGLDEWDCAGSAACQARVEAGLEPEPEAEP